MSEPQITVSRVSCPGSRAGARDGNVLLILVLAIAAGVGAWQMGWFDGMLEREQEVEIEGAEVRRGPLRISEVVKGNLEAKNSISLKSEIQGRSTIIFLEEEGTMVEEGQLIAELDVSQLEDDLVRQEIEVKNAEANYTKAKEQYEIQEIQNESDIAAALLALELAKLDLAKYLGQEEYVEGDVFKREEGARDAVDEEGQVSSEGTAQIGGGGEWHNELAKAEETVLLREEDLNQAIKELDASTVLRKGSFISESEFEGDQLAAKRAEIQRDQAQRELELMLKFGNRRKLAELEADVETRERDVDKTEKQALARLADFLAARESAIYTLEREKQQLGEMRSQVSKAKITAPESGLLVYARERSRWGQGDAIDEGTEVRERQVIATIPRTGGMTVQASVHETKLKKIEVGQSCLVTIDAFPNKVFDGRVDFVAVMADSGSWRSNPNQRLYKADIALLETTPQMRPGMSASVEILVDDLDDVHYVPRQCVFVDGGESIVFLVENGDAVRTPVKVGMDNTKWVVIEEGVEEGQIVAMAPPADFEPAPVPEEEIQPGDSGGGDGAGEGGAKKPGQRGGRPSRQGGGDSEAKANASMPAGIPESMRDKVTPEMIEKWKQRKASGGGGRPDGDAGGRSSGRPRGRSGGDDGASQED